METGQASYSDFKPHENNLQTPSKPLGRSFPRGVSPRDPSDSDLDPEMQETIQSISSGQRAINRTGIDGVMKALEEAELAKATTEEERKSIACKWVQRRQRRDAMRRQQDTGKRIIL